MEKDRKYVHIVANPRSRTVNERNGSGAVTVYSSLVEQI